METENVCVSPPAETKKRMRFTPEEDKLLASIVKNEKNKSWKEIAKNFPGRNAAQCRDRYNQYLFKKIVNKPWTWEEDRLIIKLYKQLGPHWVKIASHLPGRNGNNVKNHWNTALIDYHDISYKKTKQERRSKKEKWTEDNYIVEKPTKIIDDNYCSFLVSIQNLLAFNE